MNEEIDEILGKKVKDVVTQLKGIAVAKCIYLNGCIQYALQAKVNDDGEIPKEFWVDKEQIEIKSKEKILNELLSTMEQEVTEDDESFAPTWPPRSGGGNRPHPEMR